MGEIQVSIIIPVYNAEQYLAECLESVLNQTLLEIEVICVDDGSTDGSSDILRQYADADRRIRCIRQENQGAGAARNLGMTRANGAYLAFLDADDLYYPNALETAYRRARQLQADILIFEAEYFRAQDAVVFTERANTKLYSGRQVFSSKDIPQVIFQMTSCNTWNKLYRREFVNGAQLTYQEIKTANDLCFVYAAIACAERIAVLEMPLVRHRVLSRGNLQSIKRRTPLNFIAALVELKENLQSRGMWTQLQRSYLNCALFHCAFNYQTVGAYGKRRIVDRGPELCKLLEFTQHDRNYYYSLKDYDLVCGLLYLEKGISDGRDSVKTLRQRIKNIFKHILPPPVNTFNREISRLRQDMLELNTCVEGQQKRHQEYSEKLLEALLERMTGLESAQIEIMGQINALKTGPVEVIEKVAHVENQVGKIMHALSEHHQALSSLIEETGLQQEQLLESVERVRQKTVESTRYASEAVWAEIFNNTISSSTWLTNKSFSPGRWAVGYQALYVIYRVLNETRPRRILELGLGQSTRMISQYAASCEAVEHIIVEHDQEWIDFFKNDFQLSPQSRIMQMEREMVSYKEAEAVRVFRGFQEAFTGQKFDFIFIDAPLGSDMKQYARIDVLQILPLCLSNDFILMIDDAERSGEAHTAAEIESRLSECNVKYKKGRYRGKKDCVLICSEKVRFLISL